MNFKQINMIPKEKDVIKLIERAKNKDIKAFQKLLDIINYSSNLYYKPGEILSINTAYTGYLETKKLFE